MNYQSLTRSGNSGGWVGSCWVCQAKFGPVFWVNKIEVQFYCNFEWVRFKLSYKVVNPNRQVESKSSQAKFDPIFSCQ